MLFCLIIIVYVTGKFHPAQNYLYRDVVDIAAVIAINNLTDEKFDKTTIPSDCTCSEVSYFLCNNGYEQIRIAENGTNLQQTSFNLLYQTKILIHGYNSNRFLDNLLYIKDEYLKKGKTNVFMVDWESLANGLFYPSAVWNSKIAGKCIAKLIQALQEMNNTDIHLIGFSLGAHVAGFVSTYLLPQKVDRITGLDPAFPGFTAVHPEDKLDPSDANFVDVIHTNAFVQGTPEQLGHVDFFVNGGSLQPGCWNERNVLACSHHRALSYFGESINSDRGFWAWSCKSYLDFILGRCRESDFITPMGDDINREIRGIYVVLTGFSKPFAKGRPKPPASSNGSQATMLHSLTNALNKLFLGE